MPEGYPQGKISTFLLDPYYDENGTSLPGSKDHQECGRRLRTKPRGNLRGLPRRGSGATQPEASLGSNQGHFTLKSPLCDYTGRISILDLFLKKKSGCARHQAKLRLRLFNEYR